MSGYWNNELKFSLDTNSGNMSTYTDNGKKVFTVDTNNRAMYLYNENEKTAIQCYGKTGDIMCNSITTKNHTLD